MPVKPMWNHILLDVLSLRRKSSLPLWTQSCSQRMCLPSQQQWCEEQPVLVSYAMPSAVKILLTSLKQNHILLLLSQAQQAKLPTDNPSQPFTASSGSHQDRFRIGRVSVDGCKVQPLHPSVPWRKTKGSTSRPNLPTNIEITAEIENVRKCLRFRTLKNDEIQTVQDKRKDYATCFCCRERCNAHYLNKVRLIVGCIQQSCYLKDEQSLPGFYCEV